MTSLLTVFAGLIALILTVDVTRTIRTLRSQCVALEARARRGAGFEV